jgi:hypothetical protein
MNDMAEVWSLPWHELQRRLAEGPGPAAPHAITNAAVHATANPRCAGSRNVGAPAGNWLTRAERRADAMKARIMAKIEGLEDYTISQEWKVEPSVNSLNIGRRT